MDGWIKLHRKILEWEWYHDTNTRDLFIHCLLRANHKDGKWRGINIPRGSFVTSYSKLAQELNFTTRGVRTSINHLKSTNELTYQSTRQYSMITINNYDQYQSDDTQSDKQVTHDRHTSDTRVTTNKNNKKYKNKKNKKKENTEIQEVISKFNTVRKKNIKSSKAWESNYAKWREDYSLEEILQAIGNMNRHEWLKDHDVDLVVFFRTDKDWISQCLNLGIHEQALEPIDMPF